MTSRFLFATIAVLLSSTLVFGQFSNGGSATDYTFGNVGIGTSSPSTELTLFDSDGPAGLSLQSENAGRYWLASQYNQLQIGGQSGNLPSTGALNIDLNGNIGIGSSPTTAKLYVNGLVKTNSLFQVLDGSSRFNGGVNIAGGYMNLYSSQGEMNVNIRSYGVSYFNGGNVGIGTDAPIGMLSVKSAGTIGLNGDWSKSYIYIEDETQKMGIDPNQIYSGQDLNLHATGFMKFFTNDISRFMISENGTVGIGTDAPSAKLDIAGFSAGEKILRFATERPWYFTAAGTGADTRLQLRSESNDKRFEIAGYSGDIISSFYASNTASNQRVIHVPNGGRVGIGMESPVYTLDVNGSARMLGELYVNKINSNGLNFTITQNKNDVFSVEGTSVGNQSLGWYSLPASGSTEDNEEMGQIGILSGWNGLRFYTGQKMAMAITNDYNDANDKTGKVIIYKKLEAPDIEVKNVDLPDYVFADDYNLKSLEEVEQFIGENSHLPEVPSACEVAENGMNITEMSNAMLKKIEEMTLYLIDQNKQVQNQTKRIEELEKQNALLMELLNK